MTFELTRAAETPSAQRGLPGVALDELLGAEMTKDAKYHIVALEPAAVPGMLRAVACGLVAEHEIRDTLAACAATLEAYPTAADFQAKLDALGVAISDAGYKWTPAMREAYESAPNA